MVGPQQDQEVQEESPIVGRVVTEPAVRYGSPFASSGKPENDASEGPDGAAADDGQTRPESKEAGSPTKTDIVASAESMTAPMDVGVTSETAGGGVVGAVLMIPFAVAGCWWFPLGGVMIAGLGGALSLFGLASRWPTWSTALLGIHMLLFGVAAWQLM